MGNKLKLFLAFLATAGTVSGVELVLGDTYIGHSLGRQNPQYYSLELRENPAGSALVFDLTVEPDQECDPDIYISKLHRQPSRRRSQWRCSAFGQDVCIVPAMQTSSGSTFYAAVHSNKECRYRLKTYLASEYELADGLRIADTLMNGESKLYKFFIPADEEVTSADVDLSLAAFNSSSVRMAVVKCTNETQQPKLDSGFNIVPTWLGLSTTVDREDDQEFRNAWYKILVTSAVDTKYALIFHSNKGVKKIKTQVGDLYDIVRARRMTCYEYNISKAEDDIEIVLNAYSGNPDIFVSPAEVPKDRKNSWRYPMEQWTTS